MKRLVFSLVLCSLFFITSSVFARSSIVPYSVQTPEDIEFWFRNEFIFQEEDQGKDHWKTPAQTVKDRGGDCEDFAFLASYTLHYIFYKSTVLGVKLKTNDIGHAITVFKENDGTLSFFSNQYYFPVHAKSVREILNKYFQSWEFYQVITPFRRVLKQVPRYQKNKNNNIEKLPTGKTYYRNKDGELTEGFVMCDCLEQGKEFFPDKSFKTIRDMCIEAYRDYLIEQGEDVGVGSFYEDGQCEVK